MRKHLKIIEMNRATGGQRFANYLIDLLALFALNFVISLASMFLYEMTSAYFFYFYNNGGMVWEFLSGYVISTVYYFMWEYFSNGRTLGKIVTGTRAVSIDGEDASTTQIWYRSLCRLIPFNAFSFLGENGWHDTLSQTRVIDIKKYLADRQIKEEIEAIGTKEIA
ncbi:RDD family protein [Chryseobacterium caseinilyticum]|uniref:RDD family protein n=1 Tax=Chryseobacterium caseinilyticum TaxID=2771428 RepID=A0ABR8ZFV0_9FLAO|nr:RDD family protein [Chryseobacterium caseinilyticum]MBD8084181.1 RDD family protein [Chryseobacterium caseinilyticum]